MDHWSVLDWIGYGGIVIAALSVAIDTAIAQSEQIRKFVPRLFAKSFTGFLPISAILVSAAAFTSEQLKTPDVLDVPDITRGTDPGAAQGWGINNGVAYIIIRK